ncbi:MAG TPA: GIY-YIG nuclease family protein [Candidatus Babeliales bacterium]|jgi:tRNA/rRNA methyltransferase|nr:GIY-YIG nuclease family protein [Candidatus Babeliales bacterium]
MLECNDRSYYIGHTDDIEKRISEHEQCKGSGYTKTRLPVKLVYVRDFMTRDEAINAEQQIKGWSRKKKKALIADDWETIKKLSNE